MHIHGAEALPEVAQKVLQVLTGKDTQKAVVLALHGTLGAGKTTFMKVLAKELGVSEEVNSPTFVIMKTYEIDDTDGKTASPFSRLCHIDAYRIEDIDEMRVLRFEELLQQKDTIIGIEWAENIAQLLPPDTLHMQLDIVGEGREISLS